MKGIYLASFEAFHPNYNIIYQEIKGNRDIGGCMLDVDLSSYDFIIATPPCNYYSRANYRRETSEYSQSTKHLLPDIIKKCIELGKPFIVENVRNRKIFNDLGLFNFPIYIFEHGRHTYWTNIDFDYISVPQYKDDIQNKSASDRQGGKNVYLVIEAFLNEIHGLI